MDTICFISNKHGSPEGRMFGRGLAGVSALDRFRLITACSGHVEVAVFNKWMERDRQADLVLPPGWDGVPDAKQDAVIQTVKASGGMLIPLDTTECNGDPRLDYMMRTASRIIVVEITAVHPILDRNRYDLSPSRAAALQWAVRRPGNIGCRTLYESGRATPLYPAAMDRHIRHFLEGGTEDHSRQLSLGL